MAILSVGALTSYVFPRYSIFFLSEEASFPLLAVSDVSDRHLLIRIDIRDHRQRGRARDAEAGGPAQVEHLLLDAGDPRGQVGLQRVQLPDVDRVGRFRPRRHVGDPSLHLVRADRHRIGAARRAVAAQHHRAVTAGGDGDVVAQRESIVGGNRVVVADRIATGATDDVRVAEGAGIGTTDDIAIADRDRLRAARLAADADGDRADRDGYRARISPGRRRATRRA